MMPLAGAALAYAAHGWLVFPLRPQAKEPLTAHGFKDATADATQLERWWRETPDANIGLHPGPSGLVVLDVDGAEGRAVATPLGLFSEPTLAVLTGRAGGVHLYYEHPGFPISNRPLAPHLDVRADEGYVVVPPSIHPSGARYCWDRAPVLALPPDVVALLRNGTQRAAPAAPLAPAAPIPEGTRNQTLASLAGTMRRRGMEAPEIAAALLVVNAARCRPPLADATVEAIASSIARYAPAATGRVPVRLETRDDVPPHPGPDLPDPTPPATGIIVALSAVKPQPVRWLWPGRIPLGKLTMLDGDPGLGKSTLTLDVSARVTTRRPFPDGAPATEGGVVVLTAEDGLADTVRPRLDAMGGDPARVVAVTGVRDTHGELLPLTLPDHLDVLRAAIAASAAVLVIIDPFSAYLASYVNSRIDHDVRRTLAPLAALAEETGVALLLIRHLNKASGGPALYRGGGSIGLIAAARSGLLVAEDPDDLTRRVFAVVKANLAPRAPSLAYRLEPTASGVARLVWAGESPHTATTLLALPENAEERSAVDDANQWLADWLADGAQPPAEVYAAAKAAGHAARTLERAKAQLGVCSEKRGFGRTGQWVWTLPKDRPTPLDRLPPSLGGLNRGAPGSLLIEKEIANTALRPPNLPKTAQLDIDRPQAVLGEPDPDVVARTAMGEGA